MAYKFLQEVGTESLCAEVKAIRQNTDAAGAAIIAISENLQDLASETENLINEVEADIETLANGIIAGEVSTPLAADDGELLLADDGAQLLAYRVL